MINVLIVDDHPIFVESLQMLLSTASFIDSVETATSGEEAIEKLKVFPANVIVLDIEMPGMSGIEATKAIKSQYPGIKIIILSMHKNRDFIGELISLGVSSYIPKDKTKEELITAILNISKEDHARYFPLEIWKIVDTVPKTQPTNDYHLTPREKQVLCKITDLANDPTAEEIAMTLNISVLAVRTHIRNIKIKTNLNRRGQLVHYAIQHKICDEIKGTTK
ncbi:MAG TPA: response regulator transcription factor [Flavilitoribacter sp.]|nr:response regulator transcription factor [Flavilitoribacter sp.]HMQ86624.1 response regulator transcription factor [Flavilitoribacter sp.]